MKIPLKDYTGLLRTPTHDQLEQGNTWAKTSLFRTVYPVLECTDMMASEVMEWITKKKDIDDPIVTKNAKWARDEVAKALTASQFNCDVDFIEEYASRIQDALYKDIIALRNELSIYLHRNKVKGAPTLCRLHTVELLLSLARYVYKTNDEVIFSKTGFHFVRNFPQYDPKKADNQWKQLCDIFYEKTNPAGVDVDLNKDKKAIKIVNKIYDKLYESGLIDATSEELIKDYTT